MGSVRAPFVAHISLGAIMGWNIALAASEDVLDEMSVAEIEDDAEEPGVDEEDDLDEDEEEDDEELDDDEAEADDDEADDLDDDDQDEEDDDEVEADMSELVETGASTNRNG